MPEILLPTASKQNEIHEDVKQLKESSGAGRKYETRIHTMTVRSGVVSSITFKGVLVSLVFRTTNSSRSAEVGEIKIDDKNIIEDDEKLYVLGGTHLNFDLDLPVKKNFSVANSGDIDNNMYVYATVKHEVSE